MRRIELAAVRQELQHDRRRGEGDEVAEEQAPGRRHAENASATGKTIAIVPSTWIGPATQTMRPSRRRLPSESSRPTVKRSSTTPSSASVSTTCDVLDERETEGAEQALPPAGSR